MNKTFYVIVIRTKFKRQTLMPVFANSHFYEHDEQLILCVRLIVKIVVAYCILLEKAKNENKRTSAEDI